jgi:hypothetical protein
MSSDAKNRLEQQARSARTSLAAEFVAFLRDNKKWWLAPILIVTLGLGALILLGGSAAAPFIYTLF